MILQSEYMDCENATCQYSEITGEKPDVDQCVRQLAYGGCRMCRYHTIPKRMTMETGGGTNDQRRN